MSAVISNGAEANAFKGDIKVEKICCVGAGYVGMSPGSSFNGNTPPSGEARLETLLCQSRLRNASTRPEPAVKHQLTAFRLTSFSQVVPPLLSSPSRTLTSR